MTKELRMINISDLHLVLRNVDEYFDYEMSPMIDKIERICKTQGLDILTIAGDLLDSIMKFDNTVIQLVQNLLQTLCNMAKAYGFEILVIKGTASHDGNQLESLRHFEYSGNPIRFFNTIQYVEIKGFILRMLPELYWDSYEDFLKCALSSYADITVFHGTVAGVDNRIELGYKTHDRKKDILIQPIDLQKNTKLFSVGGHIHNRCQVADNIWYTGSYSANSFKDANDFNRGMDYITVKQIDGTSDYDINIKFLPNTGSRRFITENITNLIINRSLDEIKNYLYMKFRSRQEFDNIRLDIDYSVLSLEQRSKVNTIRTLFADKFTFKNIKELRVLNSDESNLINNEAVFILKTDIPNEVKVEREIKSDMSIPTFLRDRLTQERIKELINVDIDTLMNS